MRSLVVDDKDGASDDQEGRYTLKCLMKLSTCSLDSSVTRRRLQEDNPLKCIAKILIS